MRDLRIICCFGPKFQTVRVEITLNDENWLIAVLLCVFGFLQTRANFVCFRHFPSIPSCESLSRLDLAQLYWLIGSHDTIHLKMALKTILIFRGKSFTSDKGSCSVEVDRTTSEPSSNPSKMKFPHVYQDEKCNEKWPFLKNRTMASLAISTKQIQCMTNYRKITIDRHVHTQYHQGAIREEGLWLGFSETRYRFVYFVRVVYLDYNKY